MRIETATFELRDNEMRELTLAETNEVAGGGTAAVFAAAHSGAGSTLSVDIDAALATSANAGAAAIEAEIAATGANNTVLLQAFASSV
jgi:hypothetical protein